MVKPVNLADLAHHLGISKVAVSKALRNHPDISEETKRRVRELAIKLDYSPNYIARNLTAKKTFTIGVIVPDVGNPFFGSAIDGIVDVASDTGYQTILTVSRENSIMEEQNLQKLISMRVDGLLVCISCQSGSASIFERLSQKNIKLVFFDRAIKNIGFDSVTVNDRKGASQLIEYMIVRGYRDIAHLAGYSALDIGRNRRLGFQDALRKHHLSIRPDWVLEGGFEEEDGYHNMQKLLQARTLPEIVFAVNIMVAKGAYRAIREKQLRIPEDIGMVGFGYGEYANMLNPPLTIMKQYPELIGRKATECLIEQINRPANTEAQNIIIPMEFSMGESCKSRK
jgi:LacI family transcriptional regulator